MTLDDRIFNFIESRLRLGAPPSDHTMMIKFGMRNTDEALTAISRLVKAGRITVDNSGLRRSIEIVDSKAPRAEPVQYAAPPVLLNKGNMRKAKPVPVRAKPASATASTTISNGRRDKLSDVIKRLADEIDEEEEREAPAPIAAPAPAQKAVDPSFKEREDAKRAEYIANLRARASELSSHIEIEKAVKSPDPTPPASEDPKPILAPELDPANFTIRSEDARKDDQEIEPTETTTIRQGDPRLGSRGPRPPRDSVLAADLSVELADYCNRTGSTRTGVARAFMNDPKFARDLLVKRWVSAATAKRMRDAFKEHPEGVPGASVGLVRKVASIRIEAGEDLVRAWLADPKSGSLEKFTADIIRIGLERRATAMETAL